MKSIKEKVQTDYPKSDILEEEMTRICYRVGFEKGANYVLDAIQSCIDRHEDGCLALEAIILTIDELKKK